MPRHEESIADRLDRLHSEHAARQRRERREQAEREGLLSGGQWSTFDFQRPGTGGRLVNINPSSNSFRRALQYEIDQMRRDAEEYSRAVLAGWDASGMLANPLTLNPIPPDLARLVCAALDEALVYIEPIDDDEPWDDDYYVETEPEPRVVNRAVVTGGGDTIQFVDTDFEWDDDGEDD